MMRPRSLVALAAPAVLLALVARSGSSSATAPTDEPSRLRCATRLAMSLTGKAADPALLAAPDPQAQIDALLATPSFAEQYARFINSQLNPEPGMTPADDATYWVAKHVLTNNKPWHELFDGKYTVEAVPGGGGTPATARVVDDPAGLGYFRSRPWMVRYAGNEEEGYRLVAAYRMQQNIIGIDVTATTNAPNVDTSASGRLSGGCRGCHYDAYFALDKVAKVLSRKTGADPDNPTFVAPTEGPQQVLDGRMIANDAELVSALVGSTDHKFRTCRLAFQFLYGRAEATCESDLFDACVDAYTSTGDVRAAVRTIAQDPSFCE